MRSCLVFPGLPVIAGNVLAAQKDYDKAKERFDPGINYVHDGLKYAKKGKK